MFGVTNDLKKNQIQLVKILITKSWMYCFLQANKISSSLLSGAIIDLGVKARSWMGWQIPILTDDNSYIITNNKH